MESEAPKMEARPPAVINAAMRLLIPPTCREHVLGDLWERYSSPSQYVADALRTLPYIIASQIRRTSDWLRLLMQILPAFVAFGGLRPALDDTGPSGWARAAAPTICVTMALVLRDAYRSLKPWSSRHAAVDAAVAVVCAVLSQGVLAIARPGLTLTGWALVGGSVATFVVLFFLRNAMPPETAFPLSITANGRLSPDDLLRDVRKFEQRIQQRNRAEVFAGALVIVGFGAFLWRGPDLLMRIGHGLAIAGALFIIYRIRTRAVGDPIAANAAQSASIAAYRRELERQRDLLRTVTWWYLLPLLPGMAVLTIGQAITRSQPAPALRVFALFLLIALLTRQLNLRAASKLQHKIDRLSEVDTEEWH